MNAQTDGWALLSEVIKADLDESLDESLSDLLCELDVFEDCVSRHKDHKEKGECMDIEIMERSAVKLFNL